MCGIIGGVARKAITGALIEGLKRLEYRGYDSAGVAVLGNDGGMDVYKNVGHVAKLEELLPEKMTGTVGIAHTRWATHGAPSVVNAHPHLSADGNIAIVHNGIIENYAVLREYLREKGIEFKTETDTEALVQLISYYYKGDLEQAVRCALLEVRGTYGIAVVDRRHPGMLVAARNGSPLILGVSDTAHWVASDMSPLAAHTKNVIFLEDGEMAVLDAESCRTTNLQAHSVVKQVEEIEMEIEALEKQHYPHFMLKEIFDQPEVIRNVCRGRLNAETGEVTLGGLTIDNRELKKLNRIILTACGTSWHAAIGGEYMLENYARIPTEVEYASEFRYRRPLLTPEDLVVVISQSGETADTLAALREAQEQGVYAMGICNVVGSSIARETDFGVYLHAGPEIGVASTKAYTAQLTTLALLTLRFGRLHHLSPERAIEIARGLEALPGQIEQILSNTDQIRKIGEEMAEAQHCLYLGRGHNFPLALEGALKIKEIAYIHAEGYPAAEMKHGPIALVDKGMPVVFIATQDRVYDKILANIEEVRARGARVIALANEGDELIHKFADRVIEIPASLDMLTPILGAVPLQLLAYYCAVARGCDVDKPRNLAKSVTVE